MSRLGFPHGARRLLIVAVAVVAALIASTLPASATDAFPTTNDQSTSISVARWWYTGVTASQVSTLINQNGARLTQIRVEDPTVPTFTVTMVGNTGAYASGWWWYFGVDANTLGSLLGQNAARLISLDPYFVNGNLRFAAVMVPNSGAQGRAWWWYFGVSASTVTTLLGQNNARLVSLRSYLSGGSTVYAVIMISNTGQDNKGWQWYPAASISTISSHVNNDHMRVISFSPGASGGWDAVLVASEGEYWWWWFGIDAATVTNNLVNHGSRLIDVDSYISGGSRVYTAVELDDANPPQSPINADSAAAHNYAEANGWAGGFHGAYFAASTPASTIVADNSNFRFEPASAIKVLYLLYTLQQGTPLTDPITYYWTNNNVPDGGVCPSTIPEIPANAHQTTVGTALAGMMQQSNNVYTRAFAIKWGLSPVQAMASGLGMSSTHLSQPFIGCGFQGGVRNELTLVDAAKLYRAVDNGSALSAPARTTFFSILAGGAPSAGDAWGTVVSQEAAGLGKSAVVPAFLADMNIRSKAGSYGFCLSGTCVPWKADYSIAGWVSIPFNGGATNRTYLFGNFVNDLVVNCNNNCAAQIAVGTALSGVAAESARSTIRAALQTW